MEKLEQNVVGKSQKLIRRSHLEIKMDILRIVKEGIEKPTQIMYKANISWAILQTHLRSLVENGFLAEFEFGNRRRYELTQKGFNILRAYLNILEQISENSPIMR
ncbi:MAG: winged helix-turn-helix domain-containing protein [Nitrososphaerales archaeon]